MTKRNKLFSDEPIFDLIVYTISIIIILVVAYPLVFIISASFSDPSKVVSGEMWLLPVDMHVEAYRRVFSDESIWNGYKNSLIYTVFGTTVNLILTTLLAYLLSRKDLPGRGYFIIIITFTMFFGGGLIPTYLV